MATVTKVFTAVIHEAEEGGYWAEVLELPGCATQGETLDEVRANLGEAIQAILEASAEEPEATMVAVETHPWVPDQKTWTGAGAAA